MGKASRPEPGAAKAALAESAEELRASKEELQARLAEMGGPAVTARPVKKLEEPKGSTPHWDYLLQEMKWMCDDFKKERRWKETNLKRIGKSAVRAREKMFNRDLKNSAIMRQTVRKLCARVAREVRGFWDKIDRVVVFKHKTEFHAKQQAAMDRHLAYLVTQTERYSTMLATKLALTDREDTQEQLAADAESAPMSDAESAAASSAVAEVASTGTRRGKRRRAAAAAAGDAPATSSPKRRARVGSGGVASGGGGGEGGAAAADDDDESDNEDWDGEEEADDEGTMDQTCETKPDEVEDELEALKREAEMTPEELRKLYYGGDAGNGVAFSEEGAGSAKDDDESDEDDWDGEEEADDEGTMDQACETKPDEVEDELEALKREAEMSPEELRKLYYGGAGENTSAAAGESGGGDTAEHMEDRDDSDEDDWDGEEEADDEGTMDQACETKPDEVEDELEALKREAEMSPEELRKLYYGGGGAGEKTGTADDADRDAGGDAAAADDDDDDDDDDSDKDDWDGEEEADDEGTMDQACETKPDEVEDELEALKREAEMSPEELRKLYYGDRTENGAAPEGAAATAEDDEDSDKDDWDGEEEADDEGTMDQACETKPDEVEDELEALKREAEMSPEELRKLYYGGAGENASAAAGESDDASSSSCSESSLSRQKREDEEADKEEDGEQSSENGLAALYDGENAIVPAGSPSAMSTGGHKYHVPFLITRDITLREYQRAGLDWLVSLWERRLNGILADEMGLGKTLQTITLLAHLASERGIWGPHLVIVPTSVLLNWETEFKRFCPGFKVLTLYGTGKERRQKRAGWTRPNSFHVCITSYQLAVQDAAVLKRRKWYYMILDEAHNIKNFRSQRWQTLLNFNTKRRLLLTGTPLQNSLMELWSLMHFLMPHVFRSQSEFKYWFSNPLNAVVEGKGKTSATQAAQARQEQDKHNAAVIKRLHTVIRPFLLRRLKVDVAKQLPGKFEHLVRVPLSRRQRFLYEDFISRSSTRKALTSGGYLGMMAILMKLRMVCNHPDIFEPRVIESPLHMEPLQIVAAAHALRICRVTGNRLGTREPLAALELDVGGGAFGLADREVGGWAGALRSRSAAEEVARLRPPKPALVEVLQERTFADQGGSKSFVTFDDSFVSEHARVELQLQRQRLLAEAEQHTQRLLHRIERNLDNWERLRPVYGEDLRRCVTLGEARVAGAFNAVFTAQVYKLRGGGPHAGSDVLAGCVKTLEERVESMLPVLERFTCATPKAVAPTPVIESTGSCGDAPGNTQQEVRNYQGQMRRLADAIRSADPRAPLSAALVHPAAIRLTLAFPDKMLVQYDCGKLQVLAKMLHELKAGGHRVLIFTQMTRMLDILEVFLNIHGHVYFRLDGATKVDERQRMMDKFNRDKRIFSFILSTRSGGLGINLTGADTVIFYDSDWNPSMDAQAQDRAHRIGQTRDVHIYRLISEHTIEENILTKANQKRELNKLSVDDGKFTVSSFLSTGGRVSELIGVDGAAGDSDEELAAPAAAAVAAPASAKEIEAAMASVEDESDKQAAARAQEEAKADQDEFDESRPIEPTESPVPGAPQPKKSNGAAAADPAAKENGEVTLADDPESGDAALTQAQFQTIEEQLRPVEQYAIGLRTYWYPIVNAVQAQLELDKMEAAQKSTWEVDQLEQEKFLLEDAGSEELIMAVDGTRFDISSYQAARKAIVSAKIYKLLTGSAWDTFTDAATGRRYYWHKDTGECTWHKPLLLASQQELRMSKRRKWARLSEDVLVRVFQLVGSGAARAACARVSRHWLRASRRPELYLWVESMLDTCGPRRGFPRDWLTIGTWVEALYENGEVWYPCLVSDVNSDGSYDVTYTDGFVEKGLRRSMLRLDGGARYNYVSPPDGSAPYGVFNKHHSSRVGCGARAPSPRRFSGLSAALEAAVPGDVIVLRAGPHRVGEGATLRIDKPVRLLGERALAVERDAFHQVRDAVRGEYETVEPGPRRVGKKAGGAQPAASRPLPPPPVEVIGIESSDNDLCSGRQDAREAEDTACTDAVLALSPAVLAKRKSDNAHVLWPFEQASGLVCGPAGVLVEAEGDVRLEGLALFFRPVETASNDGDGDGDGDGDDRQVRVVGSTKAWFDDCTLSHLHGRGSCLVVDGPEAMACLSRCLVCSSPGSGVSQRRGGLLLVASELMSNSQSGVALGEGAAWFRRCTLRRNGAALSLLAPKGAAAPGARTLLCVDGTDMRGNLGPARPSLQALGDERLRLDNCLVEDKDRFDPDPWDAALEAHEERRHAAASAATKGRGKRSPRVGPVKLSRTRGVKVERGVKTEPAKGAGGAARGRSRGGGGRGGRKRKKT